MYTASDYTHVLTQNVYKMARHEIIHPAQDSGKLMDHIRAIQEVVDEHKGSMPTGVVTHIMDECQKAYEATETELYKLTWTTVDSHAHIEHCEDDGNGALWGEVVLAAGRRVLAAADHCGAIGHDREATVLR